MKRANIAVWSAQRRVRFATKNIGNEIFWLVGKKYNYNLPWRRPEIQPLLELSAKMSPQPVGFTIHLSETSQNIPNNSIEGGCLQFIFLRACVQSSPSLKTLEYQRLPPAPRADSNPRCVERPSLLNF